MYGHEAKPSKVFAYGCSAPELNLDLVLEQFHGMHVYRNKLCELERNRRLAVDAAMLEMFPNLQELETNLTTSQSAVDTYEATIKQQNAAAKRKTATPDQKTEFRRLTTLRKTAALARKEARAEAFGSVEWKAKQAEIELAHDIKPLRATCELFWPNYLTVEADAKSMRKGGPPEFVPWRLSRQRRRIALQLQNGLPVSDLGRKKATMCYFEARDDKQAVFWMRIDSEGRNPVWTHVKVKLHRPLPLEAEIKWVYLVRDEVRNSQLAYEMTPTATRESYAWRLLFVVSSEQGFPATDLATTGRAGINFGWRRVPGGLRVATTVGDDGRIHHLMLPEKEMRRWTQADELQSTADVNFNMARDTLSAWLTRAACPESVEIFVNWLKGCKQDDRKQMERRDWKGLQNSWDHQSLQPILSGWLFEQTEHLGQWRSRARLAEVISRWRENRFSGDEHIYAAMEAWRKRNKHLTDWATYLRRKAVNWRNWIYNQFAAELRRRYRTIVLSDTNWQHVQRKAGTLDDSGESGARNWMRTAAVGRLSLALQHCGARILTGSSQYITQRHQPCGSLAQTDDVSSVLLRCEKCDVTFDRDTNAATALLHDKDAK